MLTYPIYSLKNTYSRQVAVYSRISTDPNYSSGNVVNDYYITFIQKAVVLTAKEFLAFNQKANNSRITSLADFDMTTRIILLDKSDYVLSLKKNDYVIVEGVKYSIESFTTDPTVYIIVAKALVDVKIYSAEVNNLYANGFDASFLTLVALDEFTIKYKVHINSVLTDSLLWLCCGNTYEDAMMPLTDLMLLSNGFTEFDYKELGINTGYTGDNTKYLNTRVHLVNKLDEGFTLAFYCSQALRDTKILESESDILVSSASDILTITIGTNEFEISSTAMDQTCIILTITSDTLGIYIDGELISLNSITLPSIEYGNLLIYDGIQNLIVTSILDASKIDLLSTYIKNFNQRLGR